MNERKLKRVLAIGGTVLTEGVLLLFLRYKHFEPLWMAVIAALGGLALYTHARAFLAAPGFQYLQRLTGWEREENGRTGQYDYLRVFAVAGVIITHVIQNDLRDFPGTGRYLPQVLWVLAMSANTIYVMLSAALLFGWKQERLRAFYLKRFLAVVVPMVLYYLWYASVIYRLGRGDRWISILKVPYWLIGQKVSETPHYWLIYVILSVYLVVPLMRLLTKQASYRELTKVLLALFSYQALSDIVTLTYTQAALKLPMDGWLLTACYGYWVSRPESRKYDRALMAAGALSAAVIGTVSILVQDTQLLSRYCLNSAPLMSLLCLGIFACAFHFQKRFSHPGRLVHCISRYSYGIMLIHWWSLYYQVKGRLGISSQTLPVLWLPAAFAAVMLVSWIFAFAMDNLIVMPVRSVLSAALNRILFLKQDHMNIS